MPINQLTAIVPATGEEIATAWSYASTANFNFEDKTARLVYTFYASKAGAYGGLPPLKTVEIILGATTTPAVTTTTLVTAGVPAEVDVQGVQISPAVPPVYETTTIYPEIPGLPQLIAANQEAYAALALSLDTLASSLPEFASGQIEGA